MKTGTWMIYMAMATATACAWSEAVWSCTQVSEEMRFIQREAPVGGVWWVAGPFENLGSTLELRDTSGNIHISEIVYPYLPGSLSIRVPDTAVIGDVFNAPDGADDLWLEESQSLRVVAGEVIEEMPVLSAPSVEVEKVMTRIGYSAIATVGESSCGREFGLWNEEYAEQPWLKGEVPDGFAVDVVLQERGEEPFEALSDGLRTFIVARKPGSISEHIYGIGGVFDVNARLRRTSDGATGPTVTIEADGRYDSTETRMAFQGCASTEVGRKGFPMLCLFAVAFAYRRSMARQHVGLQV
jgi:hypothetical protein